MPGLKPKECGIVFGAAPRPRRFAQAGADRRFDRLPQGDRPFSRALLAQAGKIVVAGERGAS